ncbi:MAG: MlaD family protein [Bdellovibrionales bacterium]
MDFTLDQQIKAGIFVAVGVVIVALSILFLGDDKLSLTGTYELRVQLKQVQGLSPGSQVALSGLRIGRIDSIHFAKDTSDLIATLEIDKQHQKRVTQGAIAGVKTLGALGDKYIYITPGPKDAAVLQDGEMLDSDGGEDFLDMIAKKSTDLTNVVDVVNELNALLKNLNQDGRSRVMMDNMITASAQFKALMSDARESLNKDKMRELVAHMSNIMAKLDKGDGSLGALINDPTLHQRLTSLLGESPRRQFLKPLIRETIIHQEKGTKGVVK